MIIQKKAKWPPRRLIPASLDPNCGKERDIDMEDGSRVHLPKSATCDYMVSDLGPWPRYGDGYYDDRLGKWYPSRTARREEMKREGYYFK